MYEFRNRLFHLYHQLVCTLLLRNRTHNLGNDSTMPTNNSRETYNFARNIILNTVKLKWWYKTSSDQCRETILDQNDSKNVPSFLISLFLFRLLSLHLLSFIHFVFSPSWKQPGRLTFDVLKGTHRKSAELATLKIDGISVGGGQADLAHWWDLF